MHLLLGKGEVSYRVTSHDVTKGKVITKIRHVCVTLRIHC